MFSRIIAYSLRQKLIVLLAVAAMAFTGVYSALNIPLDAVPDITNNQVQVVTVSPTLAPQEVEQRVTFPIEQNMANLPNVTEIRSISRYGLSVVTIVFDEDVPVLEARQFVREQLDLVKGSIIPDDVGSPELMPITTGLGEIYQYVLEVDKGYENAYDPMQLRTIHDWIVKRQLAGIPGIIEVSSFGGHVRQYEIGLDPGRLREFDVPVNDVIDALRTHNENAGSAYIEAGKRAQYIRTIGRLNNEKDIAGVPVAIRGGRPVTVGDLGEIGNGSAKRYGAMTMDGKGEVVGGITLMLRGENSFRTVQMVRERMKSVQKSLPEGVHIYPYLDRASLVTRTIATVEKNLLEGGLIVILVLILLLGNFRAGLIVASVIPLSLLFAFIMMDWWGVSANLMSLGAIDFGIVVDGAVIIVEGILHILIAERVGRTLSQTEMDSAISEQAGRIYNSAFFGVLIILVVFFPVMSLEGIEGKTFRPMAQVMSFALIGAMLLSLTYVPVAASIFLSKKIQPERGIALRIMTGIKNLYVPSLNWALAHRWIVTSMAVGALVFTVWLFPRLGAEFIPTLEEGDLAMQMTIQPGSSLSQSIEYSTRAETLLLENFPEVKHVVSKIGTAEVPTDPMAVEDADIMILLRPRDEWTTTDDREILVNKMKEVLEVIPGAQFEFTQPIQLRFNELMTGAKTDIAVILYGEDMEVLADLGQKVTGLIENIPGVGDVRLEQTEGLPQALIEYDRSRLARHGISIDEMNEIVRTAFAGTVTGQIYENERSFDLVVRFGTEFQQLSKLEQLQIRTATGQLIPFHQFASVRWKEGPMQISRENARRRISVGVNVRGRDTESLVRDLEERLESELRLPPGYSIEYGGQFENLVAARSRLLLVVPIALALIWILLFISFNSASLATLIFTAIPLSAIGGVLSLWIRDMPFSISAGVGFIALFGVAVLNGIVLINYFNQLKKKNMTHDDIVRQGSSMRLRPVLMTALVAALGFLPMALSNSAGAEVQKPLATVVIGGLVTATLLTLILLPVLYHWFFGPKRGINNLSAAGKTMSLILLLGATQIQAQAPVSFENLLQQGFEKDPDIRAARFGMEATLAAKKMSYQPGDMDLSYSRGEINAPLIDHQWNLSQDLGNIAGIKRRKEAVDAAVHSDQLGIDRMIREKTYMLKVRWHETVMLSRQYDRLVQRLAGARAVYEKQALRRDMGEISGADLSLIEQQIALLEMETMSLGAELDNARLQLAAAAFQETPVIPDTSGWLAADPPPDDPTAAGLWEEWWVAKERQQRSAHLANMTDFYPTPQIAAMIAQIENVQGLFSWSVGFRIPVNPGAVKAEKEKFRALNAQLSSAKESDNWQRTRRMEQLRTLAAQQWALLQSFSRETESGFSDPWTRALEAGEIDYLSYRQALDSFYMKKDREDRYRYQYFLTISEIEYLGQ